MTEKPLFFQWLARKIEAGRNGVTSTNTALDITACDRRPDYAR